MTHRITLFFLILLFVSCKATRIENQIEQSKSEMETSRFPKQIGFVNDFANIFTEEEISFLEKLLDYYKETSNKEIAVITVDAIPENLDFDQYVIHLSDSWEVGRNSQGNGLTVVLSKSMKRVRISTTDLTRNYLSDDFCKKVIDEFMIPEFKKENYYDGILLGLNELIRNWI